MVHFWQVELGRVGRGLRGRKREERGEEESRRKRRDVGKKIS